ncbi:MAG: helix-turn-helix transcriptional regulator [Bacteroidia bacterium]
MRDRNSNRSDFYQHLIMEVSVCPFVLNDLSSAQGMTYRIKPATYDEQYLDLKDKLKKRMWELINLGLTDRQKQVIELSMAGFTQNEIAKKLGINQTSVHKVLKGNIDYKNEKKRYGGAFKKITKLCQIDPEIQEILVQIQEVCEYLEL